METGAFERHLREAIDLNRRRGPLYAGASGGRSLALTRALIRRERLLLPFARWLDRRAFAYRSAGIEIMGDLFAPMCGVPPFAAAGPPAVASLGPPRASTLSAPLRAALAAGDMNRVAEEAERALDTLAPDPGCWCLLRHLLESVRRISGLAPHHVRQAAQRRLPSPEWMHRLLLRLHLLALADAVRLDRRALPLQLDGVPILCRDLPRIPPPEIAVASGHPPHDC